MCPLLALTFTACPLLSLLPTDHNKVHAADVLHATSFLLFEIIPEFSCTVTDPSERVWTGNQRTRLGNIASAFSILEVFATYMAAAVHDFDHPGRTNAFLVATRSPLVRGRVEGWLGGGGEKGDGLVK